MKFDGHATVLTILKYQMRLSITCIKDMKIIKLNNQHSGRSILEIISIMVGEYLYATDLST